MADRAAADRARRAVPARDMPRHTTDRRALQTAFCLRDAGAASIEVANTMEMSVRFIVCLPFIVYK